MTAVASSLLDFILSLFSDDEAAARYAKDPEGELERAGLHGVKPSDVDAVKNMESDYSPVSYRGHGKDKDDNHKEHDRYDGDHKEHDRYDRDHKEHDKDDDHKDWKDHDHKDWKNDDKCDEDEKPHWKNDDKCDDDDKYDWHGKHDLDKRDDYKDGGHRGNHEHHGGQETAVIHHVENNYNYTDIDVDIEHAAFAGGDAYAIWGEDVVLATGGSVAAGDDIEVDFRARDIVVGDGNVTNSDLTGVGNTNSNVETGPGDLNDNDTKVDVEIGDGNAIGLGNTVLDVSGDDNTLGDNNVEGDGNVDGNNNLVDNSEVEVDGDGNATATGLGIANADNRTDVDVELNNSLNKVDGDLAVTEVEVGDVEDSALSFAVGGDSEATDVDSEIENSIVGQNAVAGDDAENEFEFEQDNSVKLEVDDVVTGDNSAGDDLEQKLEIEDNTVLVLDPVAP
jgi:hypothetical protein